MKDRQSLHRALALEAARLMDESGFRDPAMALRKAIARLGAQTSRSDWPDLADIERARQERHRLFHATAGARDDALDAMRAAAMEAMRFFAPFSPRAAGTVVDGLVTDGSVVELHLHADDAESVQRHLVDHRIAARPGFRRVFDHRDRALDVPVWHVTVDGIGFELLVLPEAMLRQAPRPHAGQPPVSRAGPGGIRALASARGGDIQATPP